MLFGWLKRRRRKKILARPFPSEWDKYLREHVPFLGGLEDDDRLRLEGIVHVLLEEKSWEGCGGLVLTQEVTLNIASQAALLILNLNHDYYRSVQSVLIYPSTFVLPKTHNTGVLKSNHFALWISSNQKPREKAHERKMAHQHQ